MIEEEQQLEQEEQLESGEGESQADETDYEADASKQGWVPKEHYKGNPDRWVDAKTFVERGEIFRPMLHTKYKELETKWEESQRRLSEQEAAIERNNKIAEKFQERAKQEALEQLKRDQKKAWEQGDEATYDKLDKRRDAIADEFKVEPVKTAPSAPVVDPYVRKFEQENPWYGKDLVLTDTAESLDRRLIASGQFPTPELRHAEVKRLVVEAFPHKFTNPAREVKNGLGSGRNPAKLTIKKGWDAIPEADKKIATGFIRSTGKTQEEYAKTYWEMSKE